MEGNIFDSVVLESEEKNEVVVIKIFIVIPPIIYDDVKGSELNQ